MKFTNKQLEQFFSGKYFHAGYDETVELASAIRVHADGEYPEDLIGERRPNESEAVMAYREKIWEPITKPYFTKVLSSLNKIRRSSEWSVRFPDQQNRLIVEGETLEDYLMKDFPFFNSITNWAFSLLLREYTIDANAWIACIPVETEDANAYLKPYPYLFRSDQVIEPESGEYLIVLSDEKAIYYVEGVPHYGDRYYIFTKDNTQRWDQIKGDRTFQIKFEYDHPVKKLPAFKMKGLVKKNIGNSFVNESRFASLAVRFNEAVREYSDLQAEVVQHIHSEKWEYGGDECEMCKGDGQVNLPGFNSRKERCETCRGTGQKPRGPYSEYILKQPMAGEQALPTPPLGYVKKDTEIVKVQDQRVENHIYHGLAAVNMEFLAQRPLTESGIAKAYDADETNNTVHSVAEDIVAMMDSVCDIVCDLRYGLILNDQARQEMLPQISVPEQFDLFSATVIETSLTSAKNNKLHPVIINAMETEFAIKKFSANPEIAHKIELIALLDPLSGVSEEDKVIRLQNKGISLEVYVLSSNIQTFIERAVDETKDKFYNMPLKDQKELLVKFAKEAVESNSVSKTVLVDSLEKDAGLQKTDRDNTEVA